MSFRFIQCAHRGCRAEEMLVLCAVCERSCCPRHSYIAAGDVLCEVCCPPTPTRVRRANQQELF